VLDTRSVLSSSSPSCDAGTALLDGNAVTDSMRERVSTTTLFRSDTCRMSVVNWATK
jgi:hypothetical protein